MLLLMINPLLLLLLLPIWTYDESIDASGITTNQLSSADAADQFSTDQTPQCPIADADVAAVAADQFTTVVAAIDPEFRTTT